MLAASLQPSVVGKILGNAIRKTGPELASNGRTRKQPTPICCRFPRSAVIGLRRLLRQELVRAIGSGFKSRFRTNTEFFAEQVVLGARRSPDSIESCAAPPRVSARVSTSPLT
jgi:hypothetical protein